MNRRLAVLLALLTAARIALLTTAGRPSDPGAWEAWTRDPDSRSYLDLAADLSDGGQDSASTRTILYPAFLAACPGPAGGYQPVLLQQFADLLTALAAGLVARAWGVRAWGVVSCFWMALPSAAAASSRVLPDTLAALAAALSGLIWSLDAASGSRRIVRTHLAVGLTLSAGAAVKPVLMFAPAAYLMLLPFSTGAGWRSRAAAAAVLLAASAAGPAAMRIRNDALFGLDAVSAQDGFEQAGRFSILSGRLTQDGIPAFRDSLEDLATVDGVLDRDSLSSLYRTVAMQELRREPLRIVWAHLTGWPGFFRASTGNTLRYLGLGRGLAPPVTIYTAALNLAVLGGVAAAALRGGVRRRAGGLLLLAAAWFAVMAVVHGPLAGPRYALTFIWSTAAAASLALPPAAVRRPSRPS
jgi:hypothetical protein